MALSTRPGTKELSRDQLLSICIIKDYINHRMEQTWNPSHYSGFLVSQFKHAMSYLFAPSSALTPEYRKKKCEYFIDKIKAMTTLEDKLTIIDELGATAREAQIAKENLIEKLKSWHISEDIINRVIKSRSHLTETFHVARHIIIQGIYRSPDAKKLDEDIAALKTKYKKYKQLTYQNIQNTITAENPKQIIAEIFIQLLDRQDAEFIYKKAGVHNRFPPGTPKSSELDVPETYKGTDDVSTVYKEIWPMLYFNTVIRNDPKRQQFFNSSMQEKETEPQTSSSSLLDDQFYESTDVQDFMRDILAKASQSTQTSPEKSAEGSDTTYSTPESAHSDDEKKWDTSVPPSEAKSPSITKASIFKIPDVFEEALLDLEKVVKEEDNKLHTKNPPPQAGSSPRPR